MSNSLEWSKIFYDCDASGYDRSSFWKRQARRCSNGLVKAVENILFWMRENFRQLLFKILFPSLQIGSAKFMCLGFILLDHKKDVRKLCRKHKTLSNVRICGIL